MRRALAAFSLGVAGRLRLRAGFAHATFRVNVQLVRMLATVKDASGALVGSLEKARFRGARQRRAAADRGLRAPDGAAAFGRGDDR